MNKKEAKQWDELNFKLDEQLKIQRDTLWHIKHIEAMMIELMAALKELGMKGKE